MRNILLNKHVILAGHYGSGKTNIAVSMAYALRAEGKRVALCDVDIVNPYFRAADAVRPMRGRHRGGRSGNGEYKPGHAAHSRYDSGGVHQPV